MTKWKWKHKCSEWSTVSFYRSFISDFFLNGYDQTFCLIQKMIMTTRYVISWWSGGGLPDEPDFHEQGRFQDNHQRGHHLPGLNPDPRIPTVISTLQKYGPLETEWDSQKLATQMLRKFQAFANKVSTFMLINHFVSWSFEIPFFNNFWKILIKL